MVNSRQHMMRGGIGNPQWDAIRAAVGRAETFLRSYPVADDVRVINHFLTHPKDVDLIVPSNRKPIRYRLMGKKQPV